MGLEACSRGADVVVNEPDRRRRAFVTEQVEEEDSVNEIVAKLKLIGKDANALLMCDKELGARIVTVPTDFSQGVQAAAKGGA